jgi:hypothetical protein
MRPRRASFRVQHEACNHEDAVWVSLVRNFNYGVYLKIVYQILFVFFVDLLFFFESARSLLLLLLFI